MLTSIYHSRIAYPKLEKKKIINTKNKEYDTKSYYD